MRYQGGKLPEAEDFSVAAKDPNLAKDIADPITKTISVEESYGQGIYGYSFSGIRAYQLTQKDGAWQIGQ